MCIITIISFSFCSVHDYISSGRHLHIVDPTEDKVYLRQVKHAKGGLQDDYQEDEHDEESCHIVFPSTGWGKCLDSLPLFSRANIDTHTPKSGKKKVTVPTGQRRAKQFLKENYLHNIETCNDELYFYMKGKCYKSYKKRISHIA